MYVADESTYLRLAQSENSAGYGTNQDAVDLASLAAMHQSVVPQLVQNNTTPVDPSPTFVRRPWLDPPDGALPFDTQDGIDLPAVGAGDTMVLTYQVPDGYDGVINYISNNVNFGGFVDFSGDIVWRILVDGKAVRNFENIKNQKGSVQIPRQVSPIRIYSNQVVTYVVNHVANGLLSGQVICALNGYVYPNRAN